MTNKERLIAHNNLIDRAINKANSLPNAGGSTNPTASPKEVNFYDYDGTILYSYTVEEAQALTELPPLPTQPGLICQGWNYDLATIKSHNRAVNVGATYITDDGKTRLYIRIATEGRMTVPLCLSQSKSNGVVIDWGDGSTTETAFGKKAKISHTYANIGNYIITLNVISGTLTLGDFATTYCVMGDTSTEAVYCNMLQKVEIGNNTNIGSYAFGSCRSLTSITIPNTIINYINQFAFEFCSSLTSITIPNNVINLRYGIFSGCSSLASITVPNSVTSIDAYAFADCFLLASITIPNSITSISLYTFYSCYSLASFIIPNSVTSIDGNAFNDCRGIAFYDFTSHTSIPTLADTNAFTSIPSDCVIKVPAALYDEWIAATNWSTYADHIVAV